MNDHTPPPVFNPLPPVVIALAVVIGGIELMFQLGETGFFAGGDIWRSIAVNNYTFFPQQFDFALDRGQFDTDLLVRMLTYPLIHLSLTHAAFVVVFILAIGNMVGGVFRAWAVLAVFFGASIAGAVVYALVFDETFPLVGGYAGVYGLIGAYTFLMWVNLVVTGGPRHQAFFLIGMLLAIQLAFALFFGSNNDWVADVAGFGAGFALSFVVSPGGWARVVDRIRRR